MTLVLLCGLTPRNSFCSISALLDAAAPLLDIEAENVENNGESVKMKIFQRLGVKETNSNVEETQRKVRETIHEFFIEGRKVFLESFQAGFTLGGEIDLEGYFHLIPPSFIKSFFFSRQKISTTVLFDVIHFVTEDITHFDPVQQQTLAGVFENLKQTHIKFKDLLHKLFQKKSKEVTDFINIFIHLCTGQTYLPDTIAHPEFKITLEFNSTECDYNYCPIVHTCDNLIKIPATCYDLNMDIFLQKLETTIKFSAFGFDMA